MTTVYKVLGQSAPVNNTLTTVYTVPAGNSAVISTIAVTNTGGTSNAKYRLAVQKAGAAISSNQYIIFDATVLANDTALFTLGITLAATDVLSANITTGNVSINVFGSEVY